MPADPHVPMTRSEALTLASNPEPWDLLVIGGGIVGAGIARDAAMRGLRVLLVEQRDLASGTSSRSSRLLHGGLRYLAQGRLGLVRESQSEKLTIQRIAPHLVDPMEFLFPATRHGPWKKWKLWIGVWLYDRLCGGGRNFGPSGFVGPEKLAELLPQLTQGQFSGAARYYDAMTSDARLVLDTCRSAAIHGAIVLNYVRAISVNRSGNIWLAEIQDTLTGQAFSLTSRTVVNACGPWADRWPAADCRLRLTKGVHLVIDRTRLEVPQPVVLTDGPRILFLIPWGRRVIVGTTDTEYSGELEEPRCDKEDVRYLLDAVNRSFTGVNLAEADVLSTWSGLRPLVWTGHGRKPSEVPRTHSIRSPQPGWLDVTGGKLTTYRLMAQDTVDCLATHLDRPLPLCRTASEPLLADPSFSGVLPPEPSEECVRHYCFNEWAVELEDVMLRRTSWSHYWPDAPNLPVQVADWMAACLGWGEQEKQGQLARYRAGVGQRMAWSR